ncbi:regulatory protein RecX [Marinomonas pollencensis]|uniref:Regulatory protein RecX n=1 Tax=Marinomonas pollencensis TaxID=491954 RepID=A0A3E0D888_9GAMM|nr:regulatory protein RecX [Marinomonas pollencensis]REG78305.1 regulatory protein [Marinomonas pollencensis]
MNKTPSTMDHALILLGGREHATKEIHNKLKLRGHNEEDIANTLQSLIEMNYLNDQRFAEIFVRNRISKPLGALRIKQELSRKGIPEELANQAIENIDADWFELAKELKERKFGVTKYQDFKEKAKQIRYLQYRGFNFDQINYALEPESDD